LTNGIFQNNPKDASSPFMKKNFFIKNILKNFSMSKNNIIFHQTCYSPRVFLMIELKIYWLLSSTLKWALEQVHPYPLFELQVTFITHDVFIVFQSSPMNMKNGIIKSERLFECNHLG